MRVLRRTAIALSLLPLPAWAADATPDGARALEQAVRGWLTGMVGPAVPVPDRLVRATASGDHYDVQVPFGADPAAPALTATARMLDAGQWSVDAIKLPSPATFTIQLPTPPKDGQSGPGPLEPVTYQMRLGQQSNQALFDPSYATASTLTSSLQDFDIKADGVGIAQTSHADRSNTVSTIRPAGADRVDLSTDSTLEGYTIAQKTGDLQPFRMVMQRAHIAGTLTGASRTRGTELVQAMVKAAMSAAAGAPKDGSKTPPPLDPNSAKLMLKAMLDFASGLTLDETVEKLAINYGDFGGTLDQVHLGLGAKATDGLFAAQMDIGMQGLALPDLPLGDMASLIPTRLALRPMVSGIAVSDLARLVDNTDQAPRPADMAALFSHGGITTGLDSFAVDVAGSSFAGMGKVVFTSPEAFTATAQITATNFDALQQRVAGMPALAQQAVPIFIFAKGIGRNLNGQIVWDVSYRDGKLLVNNQDMTALAGGGGGASGGGAAPTPDTPRRTRPQPQNRTR